jgi:hypothetical protein
MARTAKASVIEAFMKARDDQRAGRRLRGERSLDVRLLESLRITAARGCHSGRRSLARLLSNHVVGIPVRPVLVTLASALLVFRMRRLCAAQR